VARLPTYSFPAVLGLIVATLLGLTIVKYIPRNLIPVNDYTIGVQFAFSIALIVYSVLTKWRRKRV